MGEQPARADGSDQWRPSRLLLQLFALTAFAVAQPLFDVIGRTPEFLLVRRADGWDVVTWVAAVALGPTLVLGMLEAIAGVFKRSFRLAVHVELVGVLGALCVLPAINRNFDVSTAGTLGLAAVAGLLLVAAYVRAPGMRAFLTWLAPAGLVFPVLFLLRPSTMLVLAPPPLELAPIRAGSDVPIVMIVFDEFPVFALVGADGNVDATLFPNFARLAREGTWFRNATTIATLTPSAVAGILTGAAQGPLPLGNRSVQTKNLFTLLGASYHLHVRESYVPFCMDALCGEDSGVSRRARQAAMLSDAGLVLLHLAAPAAWAAQLPDPNHALLAGAAQTHWTRTPAERAAAIDDFISSIAPSATPTLHYLHVLVPHVPYVYEPSGKTCAEWRNFTAEFGWYEGEGDPLVLQQRLLMQVGWVDAMVGRLLARLEQTDLYDRTLLVLVADHGISFRANDERRALSETNACDELGVPLFIKVPGQREGGVSDRNVEVIDVLPTIAEVVGITIPWPVEGRSVFGHEAERSAKTVVGPCWRAEDRLQWPKGRASFPPRFGVDCLMNDRPNPEVAWGTGAGRIFRLGPYGDLVGHLVSDEAITAPAGMRVRLSRRDPSAGLASDEVPCLVEGEITVENGTAGGIDLAVAINGTIEALGRSQAGTTATAPFAIPVPASAFRAGHNEVRVFVPSRAGGSLRLTPTGDAPGGSAPPA